MNFNGIHQTASPILTFGSHCHVLSFSLCFIYFFDNLYKIGRTYVNMINGGRNNTMGNRSKW